MALGAMAANPGLQVQIVPVGLSYFHPDRFRSRGVVEFGRTIPVPEELVERFKLGGNEKREASAKLLNIIYDALKTVTVRAPDYETLMVCLNRPKGNSIILLIWASGYSSSPTIVSTTRTAP
jgi:glycerol-3-phosphate O-acyltransferase/dihydroxyacetone phosphate acyltransferase